MLPELSLCKTDPEKCTKVKTYLELQTMLNELFQTNWAMEYWLLKNPY